MAKEIARVSGSHDASEVAENESPSGAAVQAALLTKHRKTYRAVYCWIPAVSAQNTAPIPRETAAMTALYAEILSAYQQTGTAITNATTYSGAVMNLSS